MNSRMMTMDISALAKERVELMARLAAISQWNISGKTVDELTAVEVQRIETTKRLTEVEGLISAYVNEEDLKVQHARVTQWGEYGETDEDVVIWRPVEVPMDALERAIDFLWPHYTDPAMPKMDYAAQSPECQRLARVLAEYGDQRAREARAAARSRAEPTA